MRRGFRPRRRRRSTSSRSRAPRCRADGGPRPRAPGWESRRASFAASGWWSGGEEFLGLQVEDLLRVASERGHKHVVAPLGARYEHGCDDGHEHAVESPAAVLLPALLPSEVLDAEGEQPAVVLAHERLLVFTAIADGKPGAEEVGRVEQRWAPAHCLPINHRERLRAARFAEEEVVEPVVAVRDRERPLPVGEPRVEPRDEALDDGTVLGGQSCVVALEEPADQLAGGCLVDYGRLVEPAGRAELIVVPH